MLELNKVYHGDSSEILKQLDDESIDLVVTSPPYDSLRKYRAEKSDWNETMFKNIANELARTLKPGGVIVWNVNDQTENGGKTCTSFRQCLYFVDQCGLKLTDTMIWYKPNPVPPIPRPRYTDCFEYMFILSKGIPKTFNPIMRKSKSAGKEYTATFKKIGTDDERREATIVAKDEIVDFNVWEIPVGTKQDKFNIDGKDIKHPAIFPYDLPYKHIRTWSNPNDVVLDPFAGSGTTLMAANALNRKFIGIERNEMYYKLINAKLNETLW